MHIQGIKLKKGQAPNKSSLYEFTDDCIIQFREKNSTEVVDINFTLTEKQKGFYAEEYRPATIAKEDANVIDIMAFIIDENDRRCQWCLFDVKRDVGGEDVIFHLYAQWQAGLKYLRHSVLSYLENYQIAECIGVITRQFDEVRIAKAISSREKKIADIDCLTPVSLAGRKMMIEKPKLEAEINLLSDVINRKFCYKENGMSQYYDFDVILLTERSNGEYFCGLTMEMN